MKWVAIKKMLAMVSCTKTGITYFIRSTGFQDCNSCPYPENTGILSMTLQYTGAQ